MRISEITVRLGRTFNTGQYESGRIDVTMTAVVEEGENTDAAYEELYRKVHTKLYQKIETLVTP